MKVVIALILILLFICFANAQIYLDSTASVEDRVQDLLSLKEKKDAVKKFLMKELDK